MDVINTPLGCQWAQFRPKGAPSCPSAEYPYALACPWCPAIGGDGIGPPPEGG